MSRRIRSLKPELLEDEKVAGLSDTAFRVFIALITMADDAGRFRAPVKFIEKEIYWSAVPERAIDIALNEIAITGMVRLYVVRGQSYGHFPNWSKHQRIDNAARSILPGPDEASDDRAANLRGPPRDSAGSGEERNGMDGRGSDAPAREASQDPEPRTSERRLKSVPPPPPEPSELSRIRDAILAEPKLADLDAVDLANEALTMMLAKGYLVEWMLQCVRDCAAKSERGEQRHVRHGRLIGFWRRARPKKDPMGAKPPAHLDNSDPAAVERIRRMPKPVRFDDPRAAALVEKLGMGPGGPPAKAGSGGSA